METLVELHGIMDEKVKAIDSNEMDPLDIDNGSLTSQRMGKDRYVNAIGGKFHTPLQVASWYGMTGIVELLIKHGADPNIYGGDENGSALSAAAQSGKIGIVKLLLDAGADVHEEIFQCPPYSSKGSITGGPDVEKGHIQEGDRIHEDTRQKLQFTPMKMRDLTEWEEEYGDQIKPPIDTPDRLILARYRLTALFEAALSNDVEMVNLLLDGGALINLRNGKGGQTALISAAGLGCDEVVYTLLERGAMVDKTDLLGRTALMAACKNGEESIVRMLLERGANYDGNGKNCGSPMTEAIRMGNDKMVKILLEKSTKVDPAGNSLGKFLRASVVVGHVPTVRLFIQHGADVDQEAPLIEAVRRGHKDITRLLIENGANVNAIQRFHYRDGVPFWLYALPTTRRLAKLMLNSLKVSNLCLWPKKRVGNERHVYLWTPTVPCGSLPH